MSFFMNMLRQMLHISILSIGMIIAIMLIRQVMSKRVLAKYCYFLWLLLLVRLVFPFNIGSPLSIENYVEAPFTYFANQNTQVTRNTVEQHIITYSSLDKEVYEHQTVQDRVLQGLTYLWLFGIFAVAFIPIISYLTLKKAIMEDETVRDQNVQELLLKTQRMIAYTGYIQVKYSYYLDSPAVIGVTEPIILLPTSFIEEDNDVLEKVLLHEMVHLKKHHLFLQWLFWLVKAVYWFNPAIWLAHEWMKLDAELMCDEEVVQLLGEEKAYGHVLIDLAEHAGKSPYTINAAGLINKKSELKKRIVQLGYSHNKKRFLNVLTILLMVMIIPVFFTVKATNLPILEYFLIEESYEGETFVENYVNFTMKGYSYDTKEKVLSVTMAHEIEETFYENFSMPNQRNLFYEFFLTFPKSFQPEIRNEDIRGRGEDEMISRVGEEVYTFTLEDYDVETYGNPVIVYGGMNVRKEFDDRFIDTHRIAIDKEELPITLKVDEVVTLTVIDIEVMGNVINMVSQVDSSYEDRIHVEQRIEVEDKDGYGVGKASQGGSYGEVISEFDARMNRDIGEDDQIFIRVFGYEIFTFYNYPSHSHEEDIRWAFDIDFEKGIKIEED